MRDRTAQVWQLKVLVVELKSCRLGNSDLTLVTHMRWLDYPKFLLLFSRAELR